MTRISQFGHLTVTDTVTPKRNTDGRKVWVNFIPNIDLGHLLTMVGFAAAMATTWNIQDRRITITEQKLTAAEQQTAEMRLDIKEMKRTLEQVQQTLAVAAYITSQGKK